MKDYDFSGWATRNNRKCSDGRIILKDAFKENDGATVPLVWNHQHNEASNILGHALLENREDGVYAYGKFNDTEEGQRAKSLVEHGDISALSIYANKLKHNGPNVQHGVIREVSLVLAGANPGAYIDSIIRHGEESEEEAIIYTDESISIFHSEDSSDNKEESEVDKENTSNDKTVKDVIDSMTEEQKKVMYVLISKALEEGSTNDNEEETETETKGEDEDMKHNVFEKEEKNDVIVHSEMISDAIKDAKRRGSMKESFIAHGIEDIEYLFPDTKNVTDTPEFIKRDTGWVAKVMGAVHHTPFSRIKSMFADITEDEARAKGYIKGKLKKEEVFSLLKRTTTPQTIYKKQKLDRDDIIDITSFDVVAWLKSEMRMMLDEEIARAILVGDGRLASDDDKINEQHIRPIWTDEDLFTVKSLIVFAGTETPEERAKAFIKAAIRARKNYKGSGNPSLFVSEDILTDCLLIEDTTGRIIYDSVDKLATILRVKEIITVPVMESLTRTVDGATHSLMGIFVNLVDYNVGADKGGAVNMFDDFDIDYNSQKYLIETRCSGALIKPFSAIAIESKVSA